MDGSVPVWEAPRGPQQRTEQALTRAATGDDSRAASFSQALAYQSVPTKAAGEPPQEFGFGDLVDMVNPLQHIPIVSHIYREVSGDTIKPIGQIVGGALYGGALGAAAGIANVIVREETGKDITGNALALVGGEAPHWRDSAPEIQMADAQGPEARLSRAAKVMERAAWQDLPPTLMGFADVRAAAMPEPEPQTPPHASRGWRKHERYND
jgi:hypothetical protein